ncbi:MAG: isoleucine--tRNA ligase [Nitriliruptoraceae bacterium]
MPTPPSSTETTSTATHADIAGPDQTVAIALWPRPTAQPDLPALEHAVLDLWRQHDVFRASIEQRSSGDVWTFYEGPPTANGKPGTHHVEARVFKDVFPRYQTMKGRSVRRKAGWDCHGLPVELEVERELGLNSKADIEAYGIEAFNLRCRESVQRYVGAFEELTDRIGFWIDTDDPYRTMDPTYIDSLWWGLKQLWDGDLIFKDFRVTPYCGRCGTGLSDAEVAQGYQTTVDPSVYVRFPLVDGPLSDREARLVVWTTTPWTLPSNVACAVNPDIDYVLARTSAFGQDDELLVIAADLRERVLGDNSEIVEAVNAAELVGSHYRPPFTFVDIPDGDVHRIVVGDFVTAADGSGIVHLAPAFGTDDMTLGRREHLPAINPVDQAGRFATGPWKGIFVKDADAPIIADLDERSLLLIADEYEHTYPFCWRCKQPLIYWAKPSWYIRTTAVRDQLLENNAGIDWHPEHIRDGRFGRWLENNVDWALSRDRYWGTPLPFWTCESCDAIEVFASRTELSERVGYDLSDLDPHRPYVDDITFTCTVDGAMMRRVPDVADAWFDSGAMPYAQWGYPHQGQQEFARHYPADYICEAIDQTRGWFYTLLAESTLLFGDSSYRTCLCLGHIVDEDGRKMSKSVGNVLDPWELINQHGADPLRWLMFAEGNPWVSRRVGHQLLDDVVRRFFLTLWNTHVFFLTYASIDRFDPSTPARDVAERPPSDRWILAELAALICTVDDALHAYDVSTATRALERFVDDLSNWYVRRNRRRFWKAQAEAPIDKTDAYHTLHACLTTLAGLLAPFTPFVAERLWQDLMVHPDGRDGVPLSVHLSSFPTVDPAWRDEDLRHAMATTRRVVELGRQARNDSGVKVRQPLGQALVSVPASERTGLADLLSEIAEELNIREVELSDGTGDLVKRRLKPNFRALGPAFGPRAPAVAAAINNLDGEAADAVARSLQGDDTEFDLDVEGSVVTITDAMVEVLTTPRTGWAVAADAGSTFALDTTITPELALEGVAREIIRTLNDQRKQAGLDLADRIVVQWAFDPAELKEELHHAELDTFIAREVLATRFEDLGEADGVLTQLGELGMVTTAVAASDR